MFCLDDVLKVVYEQREQNWFHECIHNVHYTETLLLYVHQSFTLSSLFKHQCNIICANELQVQKRNPSFVQDRKTDLKFGN